MQLKFIFPILLLNLLPCHLTKTKSEVDVNNYQAKGYIFFIGVHMNNDTLKHPCIGIAGFQPCADSGKFVLDVLDNQAGRIWYLGYPIPLPPFGHAVDVDSVQSLDANLTVIRHLDGTLSTSPCAKTNYTLKLYYFYGKISYVSERLSNTETTENIYYHNKVYSFYASQHYYANEFYPLEYEKETIDFWNKTGKKEPKYWLEHKKNQQKDENNKVK